MEVMEVTVYEDKDGIYYWINSDIPIHKAYDFYKNTQPPPKTPQKKPIVINLRRCNAE